MTFSRQAMQDFVFSLQDSICGALSQLDGQVFLEDQWQRDGGGGGRSRVLQEGNVFEKAGVNVSVVHGTLNAQAAKAMVERKPIPAGTPPFFAAGISLVIHPKNPYAPTTHANYRYFEVGEGSERIFWFGGGADLTPIYLYEEDARHFHATHKNACDKHDASYYPRFKKWCDEYFYLPHRGETRGVGGIFFDDLDEPNANALFAFAQSCGAAFIPAYLPLVEKRHTQPYGEHEQRWQHLRRGRYVEFNLMYDRGTAFGLKTGGRIESILMSLPLHARWEYCHAPTPGSHEEKTLAALREPRDWLES